MADGTLAEAELPAFIVEIPADTKNGDIASNLAMAGARTWRKAPKMIADALLAHLPSIEHSVFAKVEVAGPGFINLFLAPSFWASVVLGACSNKEDGRTIVMVTHNEAQAKQTSRTVRFFDGRQVQ